jgi:hypothetical protein
MGFRSQESEARIQEKRKQDPVFLNCWPLTTGYCLLITGKDITSDNGQK